MSKKTKKQLRRENRRLREEVAKREQTAQKALRDYAASLKERAGLKRQLNQLREERADLGDALDRQYQNLLKVHRERDELADQLNALLNLIVQAQEGARK